MSSRPFRSVLCVLLFFITLFTSPTTAITTRTERAWKYTNADGSISYLLDNRRPQLYTGHFGDCLGNSLLDVTRFDAAFYKDNMTVTFHFAGTTNLTREDLMLYIGVFAYGESRFDLTFNPCGANIASLCPVRSEQAFEANGVIPLATSDVANIPSMHSHIPVNMTKLIQAAIAFSIPDFEGQAILRIFANSTQSEIGCYSALVTNGSTFSQPAAVGTVLGIFALVAMVASFATAIYGDDIPIMRKHYAHSLSVLVVFAVYQHIFFTGALSMNWPSVLVAWWSNFAWAGGMIYTSSMQDSISKMMGSTFGNTNFLGAAGAGTDATDVGGGYDVHKIYKRLVESDIVRDMHSPELESRLARRNLVDASTGFKWYGMPVRRGLPLPGNYSGFAGTLAVEDIPASNAFMTGFLWLLILLVIIAGSIVISKFVLDLLVRAGRVKTQRLNIFRSHWRGFLALALLRTCFIAFFAVMFLTIFQFTYDTKPGPTAIAAIVFIIFFISMFGLAGLAMRAQIARGTWPTRDEPTKWHHNISSLFVAGKNKESDNATITETETPARAAYSLWGLSHLDDENGRSIHEDEEYIKKYGWLASRFRRTRWWFFAAWLLYEFVRACFYAGASGHAMVQVFGLLIVEFIAFLGILRARPFEGQRLNIIVVYLLGLSKVLTVALSAAFDVNFGLARITTTAIGVVIIVIQGLLTIALLVAIALSAVTSYMSITRNKEEFRPRRLANIRERYFAHLTGAVADVPNPHPTSEESTETSSTETEEKTPYFSVNSVKRLAKIEDEDAEFQAELSAGEAARQSQLSLAEMTSAADENQHPHHSRRVSRALSVSSQMSTSSLPFGARVHRSSWSMRDYYNHDPAAAASDPDRLSLKSTGGASARTSLNYDNIPPLPGKPLRNWESSEQLRGSRVYAISSEPMPEGSAATVAAATAAAEAAGLTRPARSVNRGSGIGVGSSSSRPSSGIGAIPSSSRPVSLGGPASMSSRPVSGVPLAAVSAIGRPTTPVNKHTATPAQRSSLSASNSNNSSPGRRRSKHLLRHRESIDEEGLDIQASVEGESQQQHKAVDVVAPSVEEDAKKDKEKQVDKRQPAESQ